MPCYHPVQAHRDTPEGVVYFGPPHNVAALSLRVPCGGCDGCRRERAFQWSVRCMHEASLHESNCFVTLTYDDEHLPSDGSVDVGEFQRFVKRLRKWSNVRFSYYHVGEYGSETFRPHYHALLFGVDFLDKYRSGTRGCHVVWRSGALERLWPLGFSEVGSVTFESIAYVARYMCKKVRAPVDVDGETGEVLPGRAPEYSTMSRRPGIGAGWIDKRMCDVYPRDGIAVRGQVVRPPRYYDMRFERLRPEIMAELREERRRKVNVEDGVKRRLLVREKVAAAREVVFTSEKGL